MNQNLFGALFGVALLFTIGYISHYAAGKISSIQNDENGKPTWVYRHGWVYQEANKTGAGAAGAPSQGGAQPLVGGAPSQGGGKQQPQQLARPQGGAPSQGGAQPPVCIHPEVLNPETNQCEAPQPPPADEGAAAPPADQAQGHEGAAAPPADQGDEHGGGGGGDNNTGG